MFALLPFAFSVPSGREARLCSFPIRATDIITCDSLQMYFHQMRRHLPLLRPTLPLPHVAECLFFIVQLTIKIINFKCYKKVAQATTQAGPPWERRRHGCQTISGS